MKKALMAVNNKISPKIITVGNEQTPVIIIDDFALDTKNIIDDACHSASYARDESSFYPGLRSKLPKDYVVCALQKIYQGICHVYKIPAQLQLKPQDTYYSLITKAKDELSLIQRLPHFDTSRPYYFAILHYLNEKPHGNTGLFRHIPTGLEKIDDDNVEHYLNAAQQFIDTHGEPEQAYCTSTSTHYELYHEIEYKPNRLVIYPGHLLHSTIVCPDTDINSDPNTGRLTANIFIEFK
jgi:protein tyrosine phosphatase (PTP) superfamily phosphohydrolase (DUF442 family)